MKKFITLSILFTLLVFVAPMQVSAATSAGLKPGNFFYIFDTVSENISLFLTFNSENKVKKALEYADERLAEIEAISGENNPEAVKTAISNYEDNIVLATEKSKEVKDKGRGEDLLNLISGNALKNQEVLSAVLIKVPEEVKEAITRAIEASKRGQEEAQKKIAELNQEVATLKQGVAELKNEQKEESTVSADTQSQLDIQKLKKEVEDLKIQNEAERLMAEKASAEAETVRADAERQRLQLENDKLKAENEVAKQKLEEVNKGIYCNGKYWSQCPAGQTFTCPSSGNASCSVLKSSVDLNKAANNKSEIINLQNTAISEDRKLLEDDTNEVARANNILNQLVGVSGSASNLASELTIAHRNLFMAYQEVDASMIEYDENLKRQTENLDVEAFADEVSVAQLRNTINTNISKSSREIYERQKEIAVYDDGMRAYISILNLAF